MPTKPNYPLHLTIMLMIVVSMGASSCRRVYPSDRYNAARLDVSTLSVVIDVYHDDLGEWPGTLQDLVVLPAHLSNPGKWNGPYLVKGLPTDPWGSDYIYRITADGYTVSSAGSDGIELTDDDVLASR